MPASQGESVEHVPCTMCTRPVHRLMHRCAVDCVYGGVCQQNVTGWSALAPVNRQKLSMMAQSPKLHLWLVALRPTREFSYNGNYHNDKCQSCKRHRR